LKVNSPAEITNCAAGFRRAAFDHTAVLLLWKGKQTLYKKSVTAFGIFFVTTCDDSVKATAVTRDENSFVLLHACCRCRTSVSLLLIVKKIFHCFTTREKTLTLHKRKHRKHHFCNAKKVQLHAIKK
jgi:hypothetical protein